MYGQDLAVEVIGTGPELGPVGPHPGKRSFVLVTLGLGN